MFATCVRVTVRLRGAGALLHAVIVDTPHVCCAAIHDNSRFVDYRVLNTPLVQPAPAEGVWVLYYTYIPSMQLFMGPVMIAVLPSEYDQCVQLPTAV